MEKRIIGVLLVVCMIASLLSGCGAEVVEETGLEQKSEVEEIDSEVVTTREFTDSLGRVVTIPVELKSIAITGPLSQIYILPLAGDMLVGVSNAYAEDMQQYLPAYLYDLQEIGQLYGGKGEMDLEALLLAAPDVVIDIGEAKSGMVEDLDGLTEQTGIPFVHIDATVFTAAEAYRTLGELLNRTEKAEELATWCEATLEQAYALMEEVDAVDARKSVLYCLGDNGTNVLAKASYHAETINLMADNLAELEEVVASGAGNEVDLEQILNWNPEVILFAPDSIYTTVAESAQWQSLRAIENETYYQTPYGPYGWLSSPPSIQRYLGILWLGDLLYPEYVNYDLQEEVTEYYQLFYDCELTDEMYQTLMQGAIVSN